MVNTVMAMAKEHVFFHSPEGEAYVKFRNGGHTEIWPVTSQKYRTWLVKQAFEQYGMVPTASAMNDATQLLEAQGLYEGTEEPVLLRIGGKDGKVYIDLGDNEWRAVEVDENGWRIVNEVPIAFRRPSGMGALPVPKQGGTLDELAKFIRVRDTQDFYLVVAWILAAMRPTVNYPILHLVGEQGSAKSTTARLLRALIDPSAVPLLSPPKNESDLYATAKNAWLLAYDNLSDIPVWLSDSLCRLATGGGLAKRKLYTDGDVSLYHAVRPVILTSIEEIGTRQDLLDRSIVLEIPPIEERIPEADLWQQFGDARERILGALLDAMSAAMSCLPSVELADPPRMADFARWGTAVERALGWPERAFMEAYGRVRSDAIYSGLEDSIVAQAISVLMESNRVWCGTNGELLTELESLVDERTRRSPHWPKSPKGLSGQLRRQAAALRHVGINIVTLPREAGTGRRLIQISCDE